MFVSQRPYYRPIYKQGTEAIKCPCLKIKKDVFQIFCAYLIIAVNFETGLFGIIKDTEQRYKHVENEITNILDKRCFFIKYRGTLLVKKIIKLCLLFHPCSIAIKSLYCQLYNLDFLLNNFILAIL